jgi:hypothetical protein
MLQHRGLKCHKHKVSLYYANYGLSVVREKSECKNYILQGLIKSQFQLTCQHFAPESGVQIYGRLKLINLCYFVAQWASQTFLYNE